MQRVLAKLLATRRDAVVEAWWEKVLELYDERARNLLRRNEDPFTNPLRSTFVSAIERIVDSLAAGQDIDTARDAIREVVKLRAVQEVSPGEALDSFLVFRKALKEVAEDSWDEVAEEAMAAQDALLRFAADEYLEAQKLILDIKYREQVRRFHLLMRRASLTAPQSIWSEEPSSMNPNGAEDLL